MDYFQELKKAVVEGDECKSVELTEAALQAGISPLNIIEGGLVKGIEETGRLYQEGIYYLPELLVSARALENAMDIVMPLLTKRGDDYYIGKVVIGTVQGDLHDIGKNIVATMLKGAGFHVHDLGSDVPSENFCQAVKEYNPDILAMSALISSTMLNMEKTIKTLEKYSLRNKVKVIVGGAPVNQKFCQRIGGDGYAENANSAIMLCKEIIGH